MVWKIDFDLDAIKDINKLGKPTQRRILDYLKNRVSVSEDPRCMGKPLKGLFSKIWRYRVEHYRILVHIEDVKLTILVVAVGHRSNVYK